MPSTSSLRRRYENGWSRRVEMRRTLTISQADDELEEPYLKGFEWDPEESWTRLKVHTQKEGAPAPKKKGKKGEE